MSKLNYGPITLTGNVFVNDWLASVRSARKLPNKPERGDLKIYSRPARNAPRSRTSWGADYYPGVLQVSVYDGKGWRNLTVRLHLSELYRAHGSEDEMLKLLDAMIEKLSAHKKEQVLWAKKATKTYYLPKDRQSEVAAPETARSAGRKVTADRGTADEVPAADRITTTTEAPRETPPPAPGKPVQGTLF